MIKDTRALFLTLPAFLFSCQTSDSDRSQTSDFEIRFVEQSICGVESVPDNLSVYQLDDQLAIADEVSINNSGVASFETDTDIGSFMVIHQSSDGVDVFVATDIDSGDLGAWYFDSTETTGCNNPADSYSIEIQSDSPNTNHINWPASTPSRSSDSATYSDVDYLHKISEANGLFVAFANVSSELVYFVSDDPASLTTTSEITVDLNDSVKHSTDVRAVNITNTDTSQGKFYYASDDTYEFYAGYDSRAGANLLLDDRTTPLFFQTSAQLTSSGSPTIQWIVRKPMSTSTTSITYQTPEVSDNLQAELSALVQKTVTSYDFSGYESNGQKFDAFVEFYTITDSGNTDNWTIVRGTSGSLFTQFSLPDAYSRSDSYSDNVTYTDMSLIDFRNYEGYLHSDQGLALRDLFRQTESNQLTTLQPRAEELEMEVQEVIVIYNN